MSADIQPESEFEIAHVLCTDVVGYSTLMIDEQSNVLRTLNDVVRRTPQFQRVDTAGKLLRIPTGDGMILVFFTHPQDPVECAVQIAQALKLHPEIPLRMGLHSGPVNRVNDVNERANVAGAGINIAQRVMDCGDAGHILLSKRVAEDLAHYSKWRPHLHELGEREVKHGVKIDLFNFYDDEVGNPALPEKTREQTAARRGPGRLPQRWLMAAGVAVLVVAGVWLTAHRLQTGSSAPALVAGAPVKSIAILPFKPLGAQNRDEALELGMADTLITKLSDTREIMVPSLSAAQKYNDEKYDAVAAGRALRVNSVLEGNVQKAEGRIRVTVRLIKVADGTPMWAGTFDEKFTDVFQVQDSIAQKVAAALQLRLSEDERRRLTKRFTENPEAYQLYLKGRFHWNKYTEEGFHKSIDYFKEAIEKDPNYALAYSGLADAYSLLGEMAYAPAKESFPQGRAYAEKALGMDETLASAHLSLGIVKLFYDWDLPGAGDQLRRAKELDPNNAQIYHFYGHYLELVGRLDEGVEETKQGLALEPTNLIINSEVAFGSYLARHPDDAIRQARKTLELDPAFSYASCILVWAYEQKQMYREAMTELTRARAVSAPPDWSWIIGEIGCVEGLTGNRAAAEKIIEELKRRAATEYVDPVLLAYIYITLGDKDRAFEWLEKGYEDRSGFMGWLKIEPKFDPLRSDPRFLDLQRRMGLAEN